MFPLLFPIAIPEAQINQSWMWARGSNRQRSCLLTKRGCLGQLGRAPSQAAQDLLWSGAGKTLFWLSFPFIFSPQLRPETVWSSEEGPHIAPHPPQSSTPPLATHSVLSLLLPEALLRLLGWIHPQKLYRIWVFKIELGRAGCRRQ